MAPRWLTLWVCKAVLARQPCRNAQPCRRRSGSLPVRRSRPWSRRTSRPLSSDQWRTMNAVANHLRRNAAEAGEGPAMRRGPVRKALAPARLGIGQVRSPKGGHEQLRLTNFARCRVDDRQRGSRVIDKQSLSGNMVLARCAGRAPLVRPASGARSSGDGDRKIGCSHSRPDERRGIPPRAATASRRGA